MPDGPLKRFEPVVRTEPLPERPVGFTRANTSGLTERQLTALNVALARLIDAGLSEYQAKLTLDAALRVWLVPEDAADAKLERLLAWR